jgi:hypothetical protein
VARGAACVENDNTGAHRRVATVQPAFSLLRFSTTPVVKFSIAEYLRNPAANRAFRASQACGL